MASYNFNFKDYSRPLRDMVHAKSKSKPVRQGLIFRLEDAEGWVGFGEVAPTPSHGSETIQQAREWAETKLYSMDSEDIDNIPAPYSCCQFAVHSAIAMIEEQKRTEPAPKGSISVALLLPGSDNVLKWLSRAIDEGFKVFKIKVGANQMNYEQEVVKSVIERLPAGCRLRLDANCRFDLKKTTAWMEFLEGKPIDFFEQPVPTQEIEDIVPLLDSFSTPIALDEAISTYEALDTYSEWPGPLVFKASIAGSPKHFAQWRAGNPNADIVFSSTFETAIGFHSVLRVLAQDPAKSRRVHGFGVNRFFPMSDRFTLHGSGPRIDFDAVDLAAMVKLWKSL